MIFLIALVPIFILRAFFFEPYHLPANSMSPSYNKGDYIVVAKFGYGNYGTFGISLMHTKPTQHPARGDVIVFEYPENRSVDYIKRVIGLPNETLTYKNSRVYINDKPLPHLPTNMPNTYLEHADNQSWPISIDPNYPESTHPATPEQYNIPDNSYFVLGDNRNNSADSRYWGYVPESHIKGKVVYVFHPYQLN